VRKVTADAELSLESFEPRFSDPRSLVKVLRNRGSRVPNRSRVMRFASSMVRSWTLAMKTMPVVRSFMVRSRTGHVGACTRANRLPSAQRFCAR